MKTVCVIINKLELEHSWGWLEAGQQGSAPGLLPCSSTISDRVVSGSQQTATTVVICIVNSRERHVLKVTRPRDGDKIEQGLMQTDADLLTEA